MSSRVHLPANRSAAILFGAVALVLGACASGPADFANLRMPASEPAQAAVKTEPQQAALAQELAAAGNRQASAGRVGDNGLSSAMALAVIRQQQMEEARKLIEGVSAYPDAASAAPTCDPALDPSCPAASPAVQ